METERADDEDSALDAVQSLAYNPERYPHFIELESSNGQVDR